MTSTIPVQAYLISWHTPKDVFNFLDNGQRIKQFFSKVFKFIIIKQNIFFYLKYALKEELDHIIVVDKPMVYF